jgi:hypothetical protein
MSILHTTATSHDKDAVSVDNCSQTVSNYENSSFTVNNETFTKFLLNKVVSGKVYISSCFVKHDNFSLQ